MTREERRQLQSRTIDELSVIKEYAEDSYRLGEDTYEIAINGHTITASWDTLGYICDHLGIAIKKAEDHYYNI